MQSFLQFTRNVHISISYYVFSDRPWWPKTNPSWGIRRRDKVDPSFYSPSLGSGVTRCLCWPGTVLIYPCYVGGTMNGSLPLFHLLVWLSHVITHPMGSPVFGVLMKRQSHVKSLNSRFRVSQFGHSVAGCPWANSLISMNFRFLIY